jgi:Uma2 family endonuclease
MSTMPSSSSVSQPIIAPNEALWRLSVEQYHEMIRAGILTEDDPIELLEGLLIEKIPKNPPHRIATHLTAAALRAVIPENWYVDSQEPITLENSEPEPDICIIRGTTRDYTDRNPFAQDVALEIEVADSTLFWDRENKRRIYARAGIPVYWIVNLVDRCLEVYTNPTGATAEPDYQQTQIFAADGSVPLLIDGREVAQLAVRDLLL